MNDDTSNVWTVRIKTVSKMFSQSGVNIDLLKEVKPPKIMTMMHTASPSGRKTRLADASI